MKPLKIAFDAKRLFHNREGLGSYARTLVAELKRLYPQHDYYLCTPKLGSNSYAEAFLNKEKFHHITAPHLVPDVFWRSKGMCKALKQSGIDVYWGLSNELPFGLSKIGVRRIVTIHDMIYKTFPKQFSWADRQIYHKKFTSAIAQASMVLATSESTKHDIIKYFPNAETKVEVLYQSVSKVYTNVDAEETQNITKTHYLVVGSINERKNLRMIIEAYKLLPQEERKMVLIVGRGGKYKQEMQTLINVEGLDHCFKFKSGVSDVELVEYYKTAIALLFPSYYEGFGRPIIEALSVGTPVIGHNVSSIPELIGKYGIIIEYGNIESLREAILETNKNGASMGNSKALEKHLLQFDSELVCHNLMRMLIHDK